MLFAGRTCGLTGNTVLFAGRACSLIGNIVLFARRTCSLTVNDVLFAVVLQEMLYSAMGEPAVL